MTSTTTARGQEGAGASVAAAPAGDRSPASARFALLILLGDFVMPTGGAIWQKDMIGLLHTLGIAERAGRSALQRLGADGWFTIQRTGRESRYVLTEPALEELRRGDLRIFERPLRDWSRHWHVVIYSVPESVRSLRDDLRKQLSWLGYGQRAPGVWISPHRRTRQVQDVLEQLGATEYVTLLYAEHEGSATDSELARSCWDLDTLATRYTDFLAQHQAVLEECRGMEANKLGDAEAFVRRFWLHHDFLPLLREDPNLPVELLPEAWPGLAARQVFDELRQRLVPASNRFYDQHARD